MADPRLKDLRIQAGVVKRTAKELSFYNKEADDLRNQISKMKADNEDEFYIGKRNELLQETVNTSEDSIRRLKIAVEKLEMLTTNSSEDLAESKEFAAAKESLNLAKNEL